MSQSVIQRTFAAGELAPVLHTRADLTKYTTGLRTCRNFLVRREGGVSNRAGFRFVGACKTDDYGTRLMRYVGSIPGESFLIEMGAGYFRFYSQGGAVVVGSAPAWDVGTDYVVGDLVEDGGEFFYAIQDGVGNATSDTGFWFPLDGDVYELPTPYALDELPDWNQSGNVITLTHPAHPPRDLIFVDETHWILETIDTGPALDAPAGGAGTPGSAGALTYRYLITASALETFEESNPTTPIVVAATAVPTQAAPIVLTWTAQPEAAEFTVYSDGGFGNGTYGFLGVAATNTFRDTGQIPDFLLSPATAENLFDATGEYPAHSSQYQQRRFFAATDLAPDAVWGSRIGFRNNFSISSPLQEDDAVQFRLAGNNQHAIRHMVAIKAGLILLTDGGEWTITGAGGAKSPITPTSLVADQETYVGISAEVRPAIVGNAILYVQARGTIVRDLQFEQQVEGLAGRDLTIFATHLFERRNLLALDYQQVPDSVIWCVRDDGVLLGLTYIPDQEVWGWHRHDTDGAFEEVCVVPELEEDVLYVIVQRDIDGNEVRYIERLERRDLLAGFYNATMFFVDSGLSYHGVPADTFTGLEHLEGELVAVLADGAVIFDGLAAGATAEQLAQFTVTGGTIALDDEYENVHIGLAIEAEIETLDLDAQGTAVRDAHKRVPSLTLLVERSGRTFLAGPDSAHLDRYVAPSWDGTATVFTGPLELNITSAFNRAGRVLIRQTDPLPLTILGVVPSAETGG